MYSVALASAARELSYRTTGRELDAHTVAIRRPKLPAPMTRTGRTERSDSDGGDHVMWYGARTDSAGAEGAVVENGRRPSAAGRCRYTLPSRETPLETVM